jgi:hypothetical protein
MMASTAVKMPEFEILDEAGLKRVARIMGSNSASAKALENAKERRAKGQEVVIIKMTKTNEIIVVDITEENQA